MLPPHKILPQQSAGYKMFSQKECLKQVTLSAQEKGGHVERGGVPLEIAEVGGWLCNVESNSASKSSHFFGWRGGGGNRVERSRVLFAAPARENIAEASGCQKMRLSRATLLVAGQQVPPREER